MSRMSMKQWLISQLVSLNPNVRIEEEANSEMNLLSSAEVAFLILPENCKKLSDKYILCKEEGGVDSIFKVKMLAK